jgi:hypothetical protein
VDNGCKLFHATIYSPFCHGRKMVLYRRYRWR